MRSLSSISQQRKDTQLPPPLPFRPQTEEKPLESIEDLIKGILNIAEAHTEQQKNNVNFKDTTSEEHLDHVSRLFLEEKKKKAKLMQMQIQSYTQETGMAAGTKINHRSEMILKGKNYQPIHLRTEEILAQKQEKIQFLVQQFREEKDLKEPIPSFQPQLQTQNGSKRTFQQFLTHIDEWKQKTIIKKQENSERAVSKEMTASTFRPQINKKSIQLLKEKQKDNKKPFEEVRQNHNNQIMNELQGQDAKSKRINPRREDRSKDKENINCLNRQHSNISIGKKPFSDQFAIPQTNRTLNKHSITQKQVPHPENQSQNEPLNLALDRDDVLRMFYNQQGSLFSAEQMEDHFQKQEQLQRSLSQARQTFLASTEQFSQVDKTSLNKGQSEEPNQTLPTQHKGRESNQSPQVRRSNSPKKPTPDNLNDALNQVPYHPNLDFIINMLKKNDAPTQKRSLASSASANNLSQNQKKVGGYASRI